MSPKILTIDDSKMVRMVVIRAFKSFECTMLEAVNGADGLEVAAREKPDLILLDYTMPVMDGFETMSRFVADPDLCSIPVVMLTAESGRETIVKMAKLGVRDYLVKPFRAEIALERIARIVTLKPRNETTPEPPSKPVPVALPNLDF